MKRKLIVGAMLLAMVVTSHAFEWAYVANGSWVSNDYTSVDSSLTYKNVWRYFEDGIWSTDGNGTWPGTSSNGIGQVFSVTNSFSVEKIRMWSNRYYRTNDLYVTIYKNLDMVQIAEGSKFPIDYMVPSNLVAQFIIDPGTNAPNPGGSVGDVLEISLTNSAEYFDLAPLANTNLSYYFHIDFEDVVHADTPWNLFLWEYSENYDSNGYAVTPDGVKLASGRDLGICFQSTNPPAVVLPDIPTNWILPVADTYFSTMYRPTYNYGAAPSLDHRQYVDTNGATTRDFFSYLRFDLTALSGGTITNAEFGAVQIPYQGSHVTGRVSLLGLNNMASNTPQDWVETSIRGADLGLEYDVTINANSANDPFLTNRVTNLSEGPNSVESITNNLYYTVSGGDLVDFLNARLADGPDTNGYIFATLIIHSPPGNAYWWSYHSREKVGTLDQDKVPHLILGWEGGGPNGPQFDPTIHSIAVGSGTVTINWESDVNGTYRIERKTDLSGGSWTPTSATNLTGGAGQSTAVPVSGGNAEFYRVYGE